jgi:phage gpG-like protein
MADDATVSRGFLVRLTRRLEHPVAILKRIGAMVASRSQARFNEQKGPDGEEWPERAVPNIPGILDDLQWGASVKSRRFDARPVLLDTGRLRQSINWQLLSENEVEIGTNIPYAADHQFGAEREIQITPTIHTNLMAWLRTTVGRPWKPWLSWLLGETSIEFSIIPREFLGISDEDAEDIRQIVIDGLIPP